MDDKAIRDEVLSLLKRVAPEVEPAAIDAGAALREQVDLDSMDFLNFLISVHGRFKVDIPEQDYEKLRSLDDIVGYLRERVPA